MEIGVKTWQRLENGNPILARVGAFHLGLALILIGVGWADQRTVLGENAWIKPVKFALSAAVFCLTMAWYIGRLHGSPRWKGTLSGLMGGVMTLEVILIALQAARGTTSHFNQTSLFNGMVFTLMGLLILVNTLAVIAVARRFFQAENLDSGLAASPGLLWGARLGLIIFLLGSVVGGVMSGLNRHSVGMVDGGPGLPLLGWNTQAGDLRIAHFMGLHALQALPLAAWMLGHSATLRGRGPVLAVGSLYFLAFNLLFAQAMAGRPLLPF